jgi:hypothetical protein
VRRGEGEQRGRVDGGGGEVEVEGQRGVLGHRVRAVGVGSGDPQAPWLAATAAVDGDGERVPFFLRATASAHLLLSSSSSRPLNARQVLPSGPVHRRPATCGAPAPGGGAE